MKKWIKKALVLLLSVTALFSATACGKNNDKKGNSSSKQELVTDGKHEQFVQTTEKILCDDGVTNYKILLPKEAAANEVICANELKLFFGRATNVNLTIVEDTDGYNLATAKYISIGHTSLFKQTGEETTFEELGDSGFRLFTKNDSIFMAGYHTKGTLNAVYEYLAIQFDYDCYGTEEYSINVTPKAYFKEMDVTERPDFMYALSGEGITFTDATLRNRFRLWMQGDVWIHTGTYYFHNVLDFFPIEECFEEHREWYSAYEGSAKYSLCYYARGDETDFEEMTTYAANKTIEFFKANPTKRMITITQLDGSPAWCNCEKCTESYNQYKTHAAGTIIFANSVAKKVEAWQKESGDTRDFQISLFAYGRTKIAPVTYDEKKKEYVPISEDVVCGDHVGVYVTQQGYVYDWDEEEYSHYFEHFLQWKALSKNLTLWTYSANYQDYLAPTSLFNTMQKNYQKFATMGATLLYDQGQHNVNGKSSIFSALKAYLHSKLTWNVNADMGALTEKFFTHYFKESKNAMHQYFTEYNAYLEYLTNYTSYMEDETSRVQKKYFPLQTLKQWLAYIDEAYEAIQPLKQTDPDTYEIVYDNITLESLTIRYLLIELYENNYSQAEYMQMMLDFKEDATKVKLVRFGEHYSITQLYQKWGI